MYRFVDVYTLVCLTFKGVADQAFAWYLYKCKQVVSVVYKAGTVEVEGGSRGHGWGVP